MQYAASRCNTLQHAATRYITLQHAAPPYNALQRAVTLCNTLQHAATRCNTETHDVFGHDALALTHLNTRQLFAIQEPKHTTTQSSVFDKHCAKQSWRAI